MNAEGAKASTGSSAVRSVGYCRKYAAQPLLLDKNPDSLEHKTFSRRSRAFAWQCIGAVDALKGLALLAISFATSATSATTVNDWTAQIREASRRFSIPAQWIRNVMRAESDGRTRIDGQLITSPAGAMGLMQLMPSTWEAMRRAYGLGNDPYDPHDNIVAGAAYLRSLYDHYGYPGAVAAYNAGPGRFAEYLTSGRPLPMETVSYVGQVAGDLSGLPGPVRSRPRDKARNLVGSGELMPVTSERDTDRSAAHHGNGLFVIERVRDDD